MLVCDQLDSFHFRKDAEPYAKQVPTFVSTAVGGRDEIARWVLDRNGIGYKDEPHAPYCAIEELDLLTGEPGTDNGPALVRTDVLMYGADSVVRYYEDRCAPHLRLIPDDATQPAVMNLYKLFARQLDDLAQKYMLARLLPVPKLAREVFGTRSPFGERLRWRLFYRHMRRNLSDALNLGFNTVGERLFEIKKIFAQVEALLADGRRYLGGGKTLSLADVAFAACAAPLLLPPEFGGVTPSIQEVPDEYRADVIELRATVAGQFALRVYQEDRSLPAPQDNLPRDPTVFTCVKSRLAYRFAKAQPRLFRFLQRFFPILKVPFTRFALVNRSALLTEAMQRDNDFTIEEINSAHMASQKGAFFLGWDRTNPQFDRERNFARAVVRNDDLARVRAIVREETEKVIRLNTAFGKLDVADTLCRPVYVRMIDSYFGIAARNDRVMMDWIRILFYDLFLNLTNNKSVHARAVAAGVERRDWVRQVIRDRTAVLDAGGTLPDNVLNRMIELARTPGYEWVDEDIINRNIGGIITGVLETSNKAVIYSLGVLLDRPELLQAATQLAHARKGETELLMGKDPMYGYLAECLRFMPVQPGVFRFCEHPQTLTGGGPKAYHIKPKTKLLCLTAAAMQDPAVFPSPAAFDPTRAAAGAPYKNWGFALHECFGRYINTVLLPDFLAAVLRLPNLRRDDSMAGRGVGLKSEGGFPNNFVVAFDAPPPV
jgi:cytochrome P450